MQRRPLTLAVAFALVAGTVIVPGVGAAGRPPCLVSNERTHLGSTTLQAGIDAARAGDALVVKGTCVGSPPSGDDRGAFNVRKSLTIRGVSNKAFGPATLDGGGVARVLSVDFWEPERQGFSLTVENLTITHGYGYDGGGGGGLLVDGGTVALTNVTVVDNSAMDGGGIEIILATVSVTNSTVADNRAQTAGGGIEAALSDLTVTNTFVSDNEAAIGGGIANRGGTVTLWSSTVNGNVALQGGGILNDRSWYSGTQIPGTMTITGTYVHHNAATGLAGGVFNGNGGVMTISTSEVSENTADWVGGIGNYGTLTFAAPVTNVGGNTAEHWPGGVYNNLWDAATVTGGCPTPAGYVTYYPANSPGDYGGFTC